MASTKAMDPARPRRAPLRERLAISPELYKRVAFLPVGALTVIVLTGAAVRLTGSGLGCPDWPKCHGSELPPLSTHSVIEFGNRMVGIVVGVVTLAVAAAAWRRRPFRRDLAVLSALLPVGVAAQGVLGGLTVENELAPGYVMAHFGLSMIILVGAVALAWSARHEPGWRPRATDRAAVWPVRALLPLGALTVFVGTLVTAAGPHAGSAGTGEVVHRIDFKGSDTLTWLVHQHGALATLLGVASVGVWLLLRRRDADPGVRDAVTTVCVLLASQGIVGAAQYELHLPTEMVWIHVGLATATWLALLWATAAAGRLVPREAAVAEPAEPAAEPLRLET